MFRKLLITVLALVGAGGAQHVDRHASAAGPFVHQPRGPGCLRHSVWHLLAGRHGLRGLLQLFDFGHRCRRRPRSGASPVQDTQWGSDVLSLALRLRTRELRTSSRPTSRMITRSAPSGSRSAARATTCLMSVDTRNGSTSPGETLVRAMRRSSDVFRAWTPPAHEGLVDLASRHGGGTRRVGDQLLRHPGVPAARRTPVWSRSPRPACRASAAGGVPSSPRDSWWWKSAVLGALNMSAFFALIYVAR